jgi:hypothetical protein
MLLMEDRMRRLHFLGGFVLGLASLVAGGAAVITAQSPAPGVTLIVIMQRLALPFEVARA